MIYTKIYDPIFRKFYSINSYIGRRTLNNYLQQLGGEFDSNTNILIGGSKISCKNSCNIIKIPNLNWVPTN